MRIVIAAILVIVSKAIPYLILSLINVGTILLLSVFVLELPVKGSVLLLFAESTLAGSDAYFINGYVTANYIV